MKVRIKDAKPMKVGNSFYFLIPKQYIDNETIEVSKKYNIILED